ncbi:MAG: isopentenyl-diphosphate Delta-isomerase [Nitrospirota bacterium]|nr:MAG: isopentenyl-diphosphate Delta-isomerase [Nitrospirota bacterium]
MEYVVLVDEQDNEIGLEEKFAAHMSPPQLHRAFSVFILNAKGQLLIQKRNLEKKTWPGFWSNSCCSHPRPQEPVAVAAQRRLEEELGFACKIDFLFKFQYMAQYDKNWGEHELDYVFVGYYNGSVHPNALEVDEWAFVPLNQVDEELEKNPNVYTPWFRKCFQNFLAHVEPV